MEACKAALTSERSDKAEEDLAAHRQALKQEEVDKKAKLEEMAKERAAREAAAAAKAEDEPSEMHMEVRAARAARWPGAPQSDRDLFLFCV